MTNDSERSEMAEAKLMDQIASEVWLARERYESAPRNRKDKLEGRYEGLVLALARMADVGESAIYAARDYEGLWRVIRSGPTGYWAEFDEEL